MTQPIIYTKKQLFRFLGMQVLPKTTSGLLKVMDKIANSNVEVAVEHSRPKTMGDAANKLVDRWGKGSG